MFELLIVVALLMGLGLRPDEEDVEVWITWGGVEP